MARYLLKIGNRELALAPGIWSIGRDPSCEVRIDDDLVSRKHASLEVEDEHVYLRDLGSVNGILLNGKRVSGIVEVSPGDRFRVGHEEFGIAADDPTNWDVPGTPTRELARGSINVPQTPEAQLAALSAREREVLELLAQGFAQREIGQKLGLSTKTVETYRARIGEKLGLRTRSDLVQFALQAGLLRPT